MADLAKYQQDLEIEIEKTRKFYNTLSKREYESPTDRLEELEPAKSVVDVEVIIEKQGYETDKGLVEVARNVFTDAVEAFDIDEEVKTRTPDAPYILEHDEFFNSEWTSATLTYYEEDDVLLDPNDEIIDDVDRLVGEANLRRFGFGSRDNNVLYVRNENEERDFEIIKVQGSYSTEVFGTVKHADERHSGVRRFRTYED